MEKMKDMFLRLYVKVKDQKGEVSVEWALVAVAMALIIIAVFLPGVKGGLDTAITNIKTKLATNAIP